MRYYLVQIDNADGTPFATYTNKVAGVFDPGALQVELDLPISDYATPYGGARVCIWGIPIKVISQASDFNLKLVKVYGGMQKGLPLANPAQAGLLTSGRIFQAFGNWIGNDMTLEFTVVATGQSADAPHNIIFNWKKGSALASALDTTLATAFPDLERSIKISPKLVLPADEPGFYGSLTQFAQYLKPMTKTLIGGEYRGVSIRLVDKVLTAYDDTSVPLVKEIAFTDMIGQPTWREPNVIQVNLVMRADLAIGDRIHLPPAAVTTTSQSQPQFSRQASLFQGVFQIMFLRHLGQSRYPDAGNWITTLNAFPVAPLQGASS